MKNNNNSNPYSMKVGEEWLDQSSSIEEKLLTVPSSETITHKNNMYNFGVGKEFLEVKKQDQCDTRYSSGQSTDNAEDSV